MNRYTGKTLEEVLSKIAVEKDCDPSEIKYNVLEESKHLFGIGNSVTIEAYTKQDVKDFIFDYLGVYFSELNQGVSIEIITGDDDYKVILEGENNAILIGKGGQNLRALSMVLRAALNNTFKERIDVQLDVGHYREDKYRRIKKAAMFEAKKVQRSHIDVALDPMSADERKVIHEHLKGMHNIKTESEGEDKNRHLVIKYVENEQ